MAGQPTDAEIIRRALESFAEDLHTCLPGQVVTYDAARQAANIRPVVRHPTVKGDGAVSFEELPVLPEVPVVWPRAGGYALTFPLLPGDHVLVVFSELDESRWRQTGALGDPAMLQRHGLGYGYAIPGIAPVAQPISPLDAGDATAAVLNGPGFLRLGGPTAEALAKAASVQIHLETIRAAINAIAAGSIPQPFVVTATTKVKAE